MLERLALVNKSNVGVVPLGKSNLDIWPLFTVLEY